MGSAQPACAVIVPPQTLVAIHEDLPVHRGRAATFDCPLQPPCCAEATRSLQT
jgi:hypothetical protein